MKALHGLVLVTAWIALWGDATLANAISGALVAACVLLWFPTWRRGTVVIRPVHAIRFALYFLYKLIESSLVVARTIITPRRRIHTGIVAIPLQGCSDGLATLIANTISLTPGTLTLEVRRDPLTLYVHALHVRDPDELRDAIGTLERLALRAFGPPELVEANNIDSIETWRSP